MSAKEGFSRQSTWEGIETVSTGFSRGSSLNDELPPMPELPVELKVRIKTLGS